MRRLAFAALCLGWIATAAPAVLVADDFSGPGFAAGLVDIDGTYFFSGGKAGNAGARSYVRTEQGDFAAIDFQADLVYSIGGSGGDPGVFFGIGPATKDGSFFQEPASALYLLDHTNGFPFWPNSNIVVRANGPAPGVTDLANLAFPDGAAYARITKLGDSITFAYDHGYDGSFDPDGSYTTSLSAAAPFLPSTSYLFFGTASSPSRFDSLLVTSIAAIPEPGSYALLAAGLGLLGFAARRRTARGG